MLVSVLLTAEDEVTCSLRHVVGGVDDLSGTKGYVRVRGLRTLTPQSLAGGHHLTQGDTHLRRGRLLCGCGEGQLEWALIREGSITG